MEVRRELLPSHRIHKFYKWELGSFKFEAEASGAFVLIVTVENPWARISETRDPEIRILQPFFGNFPYQITALLESNT
jgi:hypothetical protein